MTASTQKLAAPTEGSTGLLTNHHGKNMVSASGSHSDVTCDRV
jgi:hypothetical protein